MSISELKDKWFAFVNRMNRLGVPVPTVRDPKTGKGSITASLVVVSAGLFGFCILFMLATVISKWAGVFIMTDQAFSSLKIAADYAWQFLMTAIGAYLGRFMQKGNSETSIPVEQVPPAQKKEAKQKPDDPDQQ